MVARRQTDNRWLQEVRIVCAKIQLAELIRQPQAPVVSDVKEVGDKADSRAVVDHPRIIRVEIELGKERRTSELASAAYRNFTGIEINRVWKVLANRYTRFHVEAQTEV